MFREFNVKFEDVEILGGADNLLEGTEITKVITRGDNKMSSLDSMLKNCNELDTIDGELDLNGVGDIDNLLEGTELVKSIDLKNINNESISANNSFPHVDRINIGGELYNKKAMQNVIASKDWTFDNITYSGNVGENLLAKSATMIDDDKTTIKNTLEQKARGFEIIGQTYENLVVGSGEATLLDELTLESIDGNSKEFNPHLEQPVCVEAIEGETYQNLIDGKGEYKLTDTFSTTWTKSNNSIENPPSMIEIPEIWGNTVQGYANVVTEKMIYDSITNSSVTTKVIMNSDNSLKISNWGDLDSWIPTDEDMEKHSIKLKPNTTYSMCAWRKETGERLGSLARVESDGFKGNHNSSYKFTTDDTGRVFLCPYGYVYNHVVRVYEGDIPNIADLYEFDLNYIQSVGDLYVDEEGSPILDEDGNDQYKLDIISHEYSTDIVIKNGHIGRNIIQNMKIPKNTIYTLPTDYLTPTKMLFHIIAKIDFTQAQSGYFYVLSQGGSNGLKFNKSTSSLILVCDNSEYNLGSINHNEPFIFTHRQTYDSNANTFNLSYYLNGTLVLNIPDSSWGYRGNLHLTFNSYYHTGYGGGCNGITIIYAQNSNHFENGCEEDWDKLNKWDKTTILMPQPLRKVANGRDRLYWDLSNRKYYIEKNIFSMIIDGTQQYIFVWRKDGYVAAYTPVSSPGKVFGMTIIANTLPVISQGEDDPYRSPRECVYTAWDSKIYFCLKGEHDFNYKWFVDNPITVYYHGDSSQIVETKILEKPSLETYTPKTYITTSAEIQPSQMSITNKKVDFIPLGLQPNKDYTLQLDSIGKNDKPITVNLGGTETTIQPINDTSKHHKVVVRTPSTLTTDKLELSGEGVVVNDVMLFEGGGNEIRQDVEYVEGIQNIGEPFESRNLFDYTQSELGLLDHTNGNISEDNSWKYTTDFISVKPNTTYCISQTSGSVFNYKIVEYNSSKAYLKGTNWTNSKGTDINRAYNTFTTSANTYYLRLGWQVSIFEIQLEEDTFPTEFMAYDTVRYKLELQTYDSTWDKL